MYTLHRPSQFIGFDRLQHFSPPNQTSFLNFPILVAQIDHLEPYKIYPDDSRRYTSGIGTISPDDKQISTVVQFLAIDYAMEICELHLRINPTSSTLVMAPSPMYPVLTIHRLDTTIHLDSKQLSFSNRPSLGPKLVDLRVNYTSGIDWSRKFPCAMHELQTFQLGCSQSEFDDPHSCNVQWWQDKKTITTCECLCTCNGGFRLLTFSALYMTQHYKKPVSKR
ncbi:hypothetical protein F5876DRAFT_53362 [Lentinula aff. lateritia]|uniref:Uncharacterized protein n=1 Tax=Lentinula aff. lateritia TaxID=2804960 RepID=A0ACC1TIL2_9AGAR|nr:hypothetical protein F5876DRAFT_53362 [Lentinula aff. lateritia]